MSKARLLDSVRGYMGLVQFNIAAALAVLLFGCASTPSTSAGESPAHAVPNGQDGITFAGGDGLGCDRRVIIMGIKDELHGVAAEYSWLRAKYRGYTMVSQALSRCEGHATDVMQIHTKSGEELKIYFDISAFYGKF